MELWQAALHYLGTRFRHQGRTRWNLDCIGLALLAAREVDPSWHPIQTRAYGRDPDNDDLAAYLERNFGPPVQREPQPNDILHLWVGNNHLAIVTEHPEGLGIVHTYSEAERVVHHILDATWRRRIKGIYPWHARR